MLCVLKKVSYCNWNQNVTEYKSFLILTYNKFLILVLSKATAHSQQQQRSSESPARKTGMPAAGAAKRLKTNTASLCGPADSTGTASSSSSSAAAQLAAFNQLLSSGFSASSAHLASAQS